MRTSKLKRTIAGLILSSLLLVAACAGGEVYGPPPAPAYAYPPARPYDYPYNNPDYYTPSGHSDYAPDLP